MKKIIKFILLFVFLFAPYQVLAEESIKEEYKDEIIDLTHVESDGKIHFYLFYSSTCPHCHSERNFIEDELKNLYGDRVVFYEYDVSEYSTLYDQVVNYYGYTGGGVPFTVIGDKYYVGFADSFKSIFINKLDSYIEGKEKKTTFDLPIIGEVDAFSLSIPMVGVLLGLLDGFNPCALWILLFLINIMIGLKDRKKMFVLGSVFLFTSGLVYFLSMLGISFALDLATVTWIQKGIGIVAIVAGILQLKKWYETREDTGCHVVDTKKRKKILGKVQGIIKEKNLWFALIGIVTLAVSVNLVELACSLGFPAIYSEILSINNIHGVLRILYLLLYCFCYMLDDFIIFIIAVATFSVKGISNKYNKYISIISGVLMLLMGLLLVFKPEWIMLNF